MEVADAIKAGAADFLAAGSPGATILARLHDVLHDLAPIAPIAPIADDKKQGPAGLVGSSLPMRRLFRSIERVSRFHAGVLILGESGTGKELIARAIHDCGPRRPRPFVAVNCATLGKDLLENELFGHERGAFTGANEQKKGLFELAHGGTLFLDEIGEMDVATQAKLLRVLERSEFRRVGGTDKVKVDINLVAATNRDLHAAIAAGRFREDLYYRLKVVALEVPPLRERREDIPALVETFIGAFNRRYGAKVRGIAPEAMRSLIDHDWPGNVRELKNVVESAAMLSDEDVLQKDLFDEALDSNAPNLSTPTVPVQSGSSRVSQSDDELRVSLPARIDDVERQLIFKTLRGTRSRKDAATALGIGLRTLYTKLQGYGVTAADGGDDG
ncbi:MAG: sigma-54 dependent transcriptional regulator [Deltaproteobacteria bacterium]|nr:sigma-54 dependent transcriptional regulator [Deltaproteobacteria bacterium]